MQNIKVNNQTVTPSKIICIGRNYVDHIHELGNEIPDEMVVFFKPNSAISTTLKANHNDEMLHYEGELCFVYQQGVFNAIGFGLDLTKRALQSKLKAKGLPWERAKAFDGAVVLSDFVAIAPISAIATENDDDKVAFNLSLHINNKPQQAGGTELMMYKPAAILAEIQRFVTLEDGDVVMTGTPKGVGAIQIGDIFSAKIFADNAFSTNSGQLLVEAKWQAQ